jgi:chromosome segregation ATPase
LQKRDVKKDLAKTKESLEEKTNKLLESYQNVASLEAKKTELTQELNTQKETNRALAEDLVSANETVDNLEADNMLKAKDLADLMTRVKELEAKNKELEETNKEQSSEILKARETITGLRDQHKKNKAVFEKVKQDRNEYKVIASDKPTPKGLDVFINRAKEDTKQFHQNLYDINQIRGSVNELEKDLEELKEQSFNVDLELLTRNQADIKSERENQDEDVKQDAREEDTKPGEDKEGPR